MSSATCLPFSVKETGLYALANALFSCLDILMQVLSQKYLLSSYRCCLLAF